MKIETKTWRMSNELKMTLGRSPLPQSEPTPEYWRLLTGWFSNSAVGGRERTSSVPDEDQTGTNRLELCFALPTHISPVRRWDKLLLRKLNPRQAAALDHYTSHPQIFVAICNFEVYKTFYYYLLQKSELYFFFFFLFCNICTLRIPVFSCQ